MNECQTPVSAVDSFRKQNVSYSAFYTFKCHHVRQHSWKEIKNVMRKNKYYRKILESIIYWVLNCYGNTGVWTYISRNTLFQETKERKNYWSLSKIDMTSWQNGLRLLIVLGLFHTTYDNLHTQVNNFKQRVIVCLWSFRYLSCCIYVNSF